MGKDGKKKGKKNKAGKGTPPPAPVTPAQPATTARTAPNRMPVGTKAKRFEELAQSLGWDTNLKIDGSKAGCAASRGEERMVFVWDHESLITNPLPQYTDPNGRTSNVQNVASAKRLMELSPEQAAVKSRNSGPSQRNRRAVSVATAQPMNVDLGELEDSDLVKYLQLKRIGWMNSISGQLEEAIVYPGKSVRIVSGTNGRRVVTFPEFAGRDGQGHPVAGQIRSVAISSIVGVKG